MDFPETIEVSELGKNSKIGRNHMFTLLRAKGWIHIQSSKATDIATRNGFIVMMPKKCQGASNKYATYETPHLTLSGFAEVLKDMNGMVAYISDEYKRNRIVEKIKNSELAKLLK